MGQQASVPRFPVPFDNVVRTCIISLGSATTQHPAGWLPIGASTIIPFTANYRAICWLGKHLVYLSVSIADNGIPIFHADLASSGQHITGRTPTALVTALGIALRDPHPYNGLDAFGLSHPLVQYALWGRFGAQCPLPGPLLQGPGHQPPQQLPPHLHLQLGDLLRLLQGTLASPPMPAPRVERPLSGIDVLAEVASHEAHLGAAAMPMGHTSPRAAAPPLIRGPRGWTAFTAFGMAHREQVRRDNPGASATQIEKLVGQKWAALSRDEKQHYVQLAAQIRRGSSPGQAVPESLLPGDAKRAWTDMNAAHEHDVPAKRAATPPLPPRPASEQGEMPAEPHHAVVGLQRVLSQPINAR